MKKLMVVGYCLLFLAGTLGTAAAFTIDFTTAVGSNQWNAEHGGTVTVYGHLNNYIASLRKTPNGLGTSSGSGDTWYVDGNNNYGFKEGLSFSFSEEVKVTGVSFYGFDRNDNFDFYAGNTKVLTRALANVADVSLNNYTSTWFRLFTTDTNDEYYIKSLTIADPPAPVPEPSTFLLLGVGFAGLGIYSRRRTKK